MNDYKLYAVICLLVKDADNFLIHSGNDDKYSVTVSEYPIISLGKISKFVRSLG